MLAEAVFGLNDDAFMMFVVVFLLLYCGICFGAAVVFRKGGRFPPMTEPSGASHESPVDGIEKVAIGTAVAGAPGKRGTSEALSRVGEEFSVVEKKALPGAGSVGH